MKAPNLDYTAKLLRARNSGVALVIVLGFLVLLTVLIVAFFTSVSNEYSSSKTEVAGASTRFLADSAVNLVEGQIAEGTKGQSPTNGRQTWASQPGMIRTYDDKGGGNIYKLYSASNMVAPGANAKDEMKKDVPTGWEKMTALYSDLNAPVADAKQKLHFPVVDGNIRKDQTFSNPAINKGNPFYSYGDSGAANPDIEGFAIDAGKVPNFKSSDPISSTNNPAAMPVKWMYVLKDGTVIAPDSGSSGTKATFDEAASSDPKKKPTADNPIAGRIAFWTDDESCKLNINTASEGTYYAKPHSNTKVDMNANASFTTAPPVNGEFNRYPGHPANTCLSVALGKWLGDPNLSPQFVPSAHTVKSDNDKYLGFTGTQPPATPPSNSKGLLAYMLLSPRNALGGSYAGTVNFVGTATPTTPATGAVIKDSDRLYTSVDELMFLPSRNAFPNALFKNDVIAKQRFFLTASSRAPEVTPFNTPKVSLWPQWYSDADRKAFQGPTQKLLAFCSSFGPAVPNSNPSRKQFEYFWEWASSNAGNQQGDIFAGTSSCSSTLDWTGVQRNRDLTRYLCDMGLRKLPGYAQAFRGGKYDHRTYSHIVLESLDYIRSCVARADYQSPLALGTSEGTNEHHWTAPLMVNDSFNLPGSSASMPLKGFGFFPVFSKVALGEGLNPEGSVNVRRPFLAFECFTAPWSYPAGQQCMGVRIQGLANLGIVNNDGSPIPPSVSIWKRIERRVDDGYGGYYERNLPIHTYIADLTGYKFATTTPTSVTMGLGQQPVQIMLQDGKGVTFQTMYVAFPSVTVTKVPTVPTVMNNGYASGGGAAGNWYNEVIEMFQANRSVVRGMECNKDTAARGDYRILGGTVNAASYDAILTGVTATTNLLRQHGSYPSQDMQAHSLRVFCRNNNQPIVAASGAANTPTVALAGTLAPNAILSSADYGGLVAPFAPPDLIGAKNASSRAGDWDTGTGAFPDGPYLNVGDQIDIAKRSAYFPSVDSGGGNAISFSPNRRIASAVQFGSLPTGVSAPTPRPWETLLFCPNPAARNLAPGADTKGDNGHIGFLNPPDHVFLENFTMPVVEPYAISEPLSTAGKVNMNYQLAPFTNIERSTALRGVLKSTLMTGISGYDVKDKQYKADAVSPYEVRYNINRDATLEGISKYYFDRGNIFMYPSEICDVFLVPKAIQGASYHNKAAKPPTSYDKMLEWWNPSPTSVDPLATMCMTGDNLREEPYNRLYPRLTTKSNTFTVHYRVQVLKKRTNSDQTIWEEGKDQVLAESRGATMIERYVDPSDSSFNADWDRNTLSLNFANSAVDLSRAYRFRVVSTKKFAP